MPRDAPRRYLPAASFDVLLPVYDPIMRVLGFTRSLAPLVGQAELLPRHRVLDVGCGTGTLAMIVKQRYPDLEYVGIDPDPRALARASAKASRAGVRVRFERGFGDALPHPDAAFDRVFSSMMFHHVPKAEQAAVLTEIRRVLGPGGRLEFADIAVDDERLLALLGGAGFTAARLMGRRGTLVRPVWYYQASR
jgi:ubiquinone/menaquinone biosynthesis C-methylase UbiE